jgi:phosphatidylglycerophosphatase A
MIDSIPKICATFFCIGYLPVAPGSITTIVGILISFALMGNPVVYAAVTLIVTVIGFVTSGRAEKAIGKKDPGCIVIDEVAGVMIACFLLPATLPVFWTAFFLFRAFDMFKIYPGNKFEGLGGSSGIMMDDIVAGIYTNAVMHLALRWSGI